MTAEPDTSFEDATAGPWFWLFTFNCPRAQLHELAGSPHWTIAEDGLVWDIDYWLFNVPCGLRILFSMQCEGTTDGAVAASLPQPTHVLRHYPQLKNLSVAHDYHQDAETEFALQKYRSAYPELGALSRYQVWRMGDDGNQMPVEYPTSLTDARCIIADLESHKHKQIYWFTDLANEIGKNQGMRAESPS